jgi:hypothetical protein
MRIVFSSLILLMSVATASLAQQAHYDVTPAVGNGLRFWQSDSYKIHMGSGSEYEYGPVTDYSIKMNMSNTPGRGWTWGVIGQKPVVAINTLGNMQIAGTLSIQGNIVLPSYTGNKQIYTWSADDSNWRIGMSTTPGFTTSLTTGHVQYLTYYNQPGQGFAIGVNGGQSSFEVSGSNHNAFFRGNVGLGTTNPQARLDVHGQIAVNGVGVITNGGNDVYANIRVLRNTSTQYPDGMYIGYMGSGGPLRFFSNSGTTEFMTLTTSGNLGIGTTVPNEKLTVKGTIYGREVKVDLSVPGPDYVFEKDYNLTSLEELKSYIVANKHLPEVPSAKEMEQNGIKVGEMEMLLLKKIEELTLHVIAQQEEIKEMKKNEERLTNVINQLQQKLK